MWPVFVFLGLLVFGSYPFVSLAGVGGLLLCVPSIWSFFISFIILYIARSVNGVIVAIALSTGLPVVSILVIGALNAGNHWNGDLPGFILFFSLLATVIPSLLGMFQGAAAHQTEPPGPHPNQQSTLALDAVAAKTGPVQTALPTSMPTTAPPLSTPTKEPTLIHPTPFPFSSSIFLAFITLAMVLYAYVLFAKGVIGTTASLSSASDSFEFWVYGLMALQLLAPLTFSRLGLLLPYGCIGLGLAFNLQYGLLFEPFETSAYFNYMQFILAAHGLVATAFALPYLWPRVQARIKVVQPWAYDALRQSVQSFEHSYLNDVKPQETGLRLRILHPNGSEEQQGEVDVMFAGDVDHLRLQCRFPLTPISENPILVHPKRLGLPGLLDVARRQKTGHRILDHFFVCLGDAQVVPQLAFLENTLLKLMDLYPQIRIHHDQLLIDCPFIQKDELDWIVVLDSATALWKDLDHLGQGMAPSLPQDEKESQDSLPNKLPSRPLGFSKHWLIVYAMILLVGPLVLKNQQSDMRFYEHRISDGGMEKNRWPDPQHLRSMSTFTRRTRDVHVAPCPMRMPAYCQGDTLPAGIKKGDVLSMGKRIYGQREGLWTYWWRHPDIKWQEGRYENGQPVGLWTRWSSNGTLKAKTMWISHEEAMKRYPDKERRLELSVKDGLHQEWYERGQMKLNGHFADSKKVGLWRTWYTHGQKESEGRYDPMGNKEQKVGPWSYWDQEGKLIKEEFYKDGERVLKGAQ